MRSPVFALALLVCAGCPKEPRPEEPAPPERPAEEEGAGGGEAAAGEEEKEQIAAIQRALNEFRTAVHTCWAIGAADDFRLEGRVVLALTIGAEGSTADVRVLRDEPNDERLTGCLVELWSDYRWPEVFSEGDEIQLPPLDFVAPGRQYTVSAAHAPVHELADGKLRVSVVLDEDNTGNGTAAMSILEASGGLEAPLHRHDAAEILYVFSGRGRTWGALGPRRGEDVEAGDAIYIPAEAPHGFRQVGDEPLVVLQIYAPAGPEQRFEGGGSAGTQPVDRGELRRPRRLPRPLVRATAEAPAHSILGGDGEVRILFDAESAPGDAAYLGALTLEPKATVPRHTHAGSSEYLFLIEGAGEMYVGDEAFSVQGGDGIQVPPGIEHGFVAGGEQPVKAVQLYRPPGPEQRFKKERSP